MSSKSLVMSWMRPVLVMLLLGAGAAAPAATSFTLEQVRDYAFSTSLVAASQGSQVAWLVNHQGLRNVWVASAPHFAARQLTAYSKDDGQELTSLSLSPDGKFAVYVRGGEHGGNWDRGSPADPLSMPVGTKVEIWSAALADGTVRLLSEGDYPVIAPDSSRVLFQKDGAFWIVPIDGSVAARKLFSARGRLGSPAWSADGSRLAFVSSRDSHALIGIYRDDSTPILWLAPSVARDSSPRWSADGQRIAFVRHPGRGGAPAPRLEFEPEPWSIWVADVRTGQAVQRWSSGAGLRDSYPGEPYLEWAEGDRLVFRSYADGWQHLYSLPSNGGAPTQLTRGNYMVDDVALSPDRRRLVFSANTGMQPDDLERRHLFSVSVEGRDPVQLTAGTGLEWAPAHTRAGELLFLSATAQRPPVLATTSHQGRGVRLLAPELVPVDYPVTQLVVPTSVSFAAADGKTVHGQLFEPKQATSGKRPAIVYVHGGPQRQMLLGWNARASYSNYYAVNQYLASRGYVVLSVNYRLGPGYGHDLHFPANAGVRGASEYQDVQAAARFLQARGDVDRIGIYGGSYGGYLTGLALARDSELFAAGVNIHGVHDWTLVYHADLFNRAQYEMPPDTQRALDVGWQSSPVSAVDTWRSPVLFIHGDDDRNIGLSQTVDLTRRLDKVGVRYQTLVLVDETHAILRHANALAMNRATVDFFDRQLRRARQ
ncbi:S9 family peptidase [Steroidobacter sp.]|uniref:S9 family peptidase n=1 Tax=Steroidobacter sp. TaxID=1978227 RepID=UPI001A4C19AB|nr:alpha/beta fold hydrolase [Steroidobacter sp.]MBL8266018.1 S9 family peptidase [Steroidobacter sp.]